jgi:hypothetical protein
LLHIAIRIKTIKVTRLQEQQPTALNESFFDVSMKILVWKTAMATSTELQNSNEKKAEIGSIL